MIKSDNIKADKLPFDFNKLNDELYMDRQNENPACYTTKTTTQNVDMQEFIQEINSFIQYIYDNSKNNND